MNYHDITSIVSMGRPEIMNAVTPRATGCGIPWNLTEEEIEMLWDEYVKYEDGRIMQFYEWMAKHFGRHKETCGVKWRKVLRASYDEKDS